jgi:alpha/beta superfamily hydrolase
MVRITTSDGVSLDAELARPEDGDPKAGVVIAHPHPRHGGDMHVPLVAGLFERLPRSGVAALRFDFRGVGRSGGAHDDGVGERRDVEAAVAHLADVISGPVVAAGWSFGADVSLAVGTAAVAGWFAVAPTLRVVPLDELAAAGDARPTLLAIPQHDQFNPPDRARPIVDGWPSTRVEVVPGADHFLAGRIDRVAALCLELVEELLSPRR